MDIVRIQVLFTQLFTYFSCACLFYIQGSNFIFNLSSKPVKSKRKERFSKSLDCKLGNNGVKVSGFSGFYVDFRRSPSFRSKALPCRACSFNTVRQTTGLNKIRSQLVAQFMPFSSTHSAYFNVLRKEVPYFNVSQQNRVEFNCFATKTMLRHAKDVRPASLL